MNNARNESNGMTLIDSRYATPTKWQSLDRQKGTLTVIMIIRINNNQSDRKNSPIFLIMCVVVENYSDSGNALSL